MNGLDWANLLWEARGFLGLDDDEPVPTDELVEQAKANGYGERETRQALREADELTAVGDADDLRVRLTEKAAEGGREEPETTDANPTPEAGEPAEGDGGNDESDAEPAATAADWSDADFTAPVSGVWPTEYVERERWMGHTEGEKQPFAPWGDSDAPVSCDHHSDPRTCEECGHDARYKWGYSGNYTGHDTAEEWLEYDPRLAGLAFIQREQPGEGPGDGETDPLAFVDGDDVRDPETGEIHPAFAAYLEHLGITYADISVSGSGVHAVYRGELPGDGSQATFEIDTEPWGANDEPPAVEIFDSKHVCIATGEHVPGTPTNANEWDTDALEAILRAVGEYKDRSPSAGAAERFDVEQYEPEATESTDTTDDIRDIYAALDRLDARRVGERTIVREWVEPDHREVRAFAPTWASADYSGTAVIATADGFKDTGKRGGSGGPAAMAAIDARLVDDTDAPDAVEGRVWWEALEHLRELGFDVPEYDGGDTDSGDGVEYDSDPRELSATVDHRRAWDAAKRVTPAELPGDEFDARSGGDTFACPCCGAGVDVVQAVAVDSGLVESCSAPLSDHYPTAYNRAREQYGAPLPRYYTTADAVAEFGAVLDVIAEVDFWHLDADALASDVTAEGDDVSGEAIRALNPAWRESETGESVLVFDSGTVWDADTERSLDVLRFVALDAGIISHPDDELAGDLFTTAYRRAREQYGAPLPRWEPALDGSRDITPMLPPAEELLDGGAPEGVDTDALDDARQEVESVILRAASQYGSDDATVVTALPALGKTTGTVKTAREKPLSYLAPRKELQAQALDKAERWGVEARILPVFAEGMVRDEVLNPAVSYVREEGKDRLRDRWSVLNATLGEGDDEGDEPDDIFVDVDEEGDEVELDRPTCETADGEHGRAWALTVHVARKLGYTPREIHTQAQGLFGAELPCSGEDCCSYSAGWERVRDADEPADLLVGSYVHAHVESARTHYSRDADGGVERSARALVFDEFVGEAFVREYDEKALDFATWLARALRDDVADRRDMLQADLWDDEFLRAWLAGESADHGAVSDATEGLGRMVDLLDAREAAGDVLGEVDDELLDSLGLAEPLGAVVDASTDPRVAFRELSAAVDAVDPAAPGSGVAGWVTDDVLDSLDTATDAGASVPDADVDVDALPISGDLRELVEEATEAASTNQEGAHGRLRAAVTALSGGQEGCRRLAAWANDGYAHPNAHHLLYAVAAPTEGDDAVGRRIATSSWAFDDSATEGTMLDVVDTAGRARTVLDRNDHGALLQTPPSRTAGDGSDVPIIGLDATGRAELWENALRLDVTTRDIHNTPAERAAFLENTLDLRILQASDRPRPYSGDAESKDTDGDVALLESLAEEYSGIDAPRERGGEPVSVGSPAAITSKGVRELLENDSRLDDVVSEWEHFGNLTGANHLGGHRLAAILGSQHYGDDAVERFAALAGQEVDTSRELGRGAELDYGNDLANAYLGHMREDQVMQAVLRFARGGSGATVVARTSALRDDLPVVGEAQVVETWGDTATAIARRYRRLGDEFTAADVADAVDVTRRHVGRVLGELVEAGYLERLDAGAGRATVYGRGSSPGAGEVDLPDRLDAVDAGQPVQSPSSNTYTWNVGVRGLDAGGEPASSPIVGRPTGAPPAPTPADGGEPPG